MAANTVVIHDTDYIDFQLLYLQDQKLSTLSWHSFPEWGSDGVDVSFSYNGCHYIGYE